MLARGASVKHHEDKPMKRITPSRKLLCAALTASWCLGAQAQVQPGSNVESLLSMAREGNPDFASMRYEADAATERITPAGEIGRAHV